MKLEGHVPGPGKATDQLPHGSSAARFNTWLALKVTNGVGTSGARIPRRGGLREPAAAITSHSPVIIVSWISRTFLQLVLLSVIIVGQNVLAAAADARAEATYSDADAVIHESVKIQDHLAAQDALLVSLIDGAARKTVP